MLLSSSDNRWKDKEVPSRLRGQLNECWLERLPEGTKKILCINDFQFLGTFTIGRAYLWISTICYLTLLIITVSRYKIVYNYRNYLVLKTSVKNNCVNEPFREIIQSYNKTGTKRKPGVHQYLTTRKHVSPMKWLNDRKCDRPWWRLIDWIFSGITLCDTFLRWFVTLEQVGKMSCLAALPNTFRWLAAFYIILTVSFLSIMVFISIR